MYPLAHQLLVGENPQVGLDVLDALGRRRRRADRSQRAVRKDPAEHGGGLGNVFGALRETVDARA
jgi:hypothetical protein